MTKYKTRHIAEIVCKLEEVSHVYGKMCAVEDYRNPDVWAMRETLRWVLMLRQNLPVYPQDLVAE